MGHYYTYGLRIQSDLPLPELERSEAGRCDVRFVVAPGSDSLDAGAGEELLSWEEVGQFLVSRGTTVTIDLHEGVDRELARLPLLGPVLGTLLRQRGRVVLHASAVSIAGRVTAFVGHKGYGKSTTAGALHARGHSLVTDDILPIKGTSEGSPCAWPGFPRLSMWPDAVSALGKDPSALQGLHERVSKKAVPAADGFVAQRPLPMGGIYVLGKGDQLACEGLSPRNAFIELLRHSYCSSQLSQLEPDALSPLFQQYSQLVEAVPVRRLERPRDLDALPKIARIIEENTQSEAPSSQAPEGLVGTSSF